MRQLQTERMKRMPGMAQPFGQRRSHTGFNAFEKRCLPIRSIQLVTDDRRPHRRQMDPQLVLSTRLRPQDDHGELPLALSDLVVGPSRQPLPARPSTHQNVQSPIGRRHRNVDDSSIRQGSSSDRHVGLLDLALFEGDFQASTGRRGPPTGHQTARLAIEPMGRSGEPAPQTAGGGGRSAYFGGRSRSGASATRPVCRCRSTMRRRRRSQTSAAYRGSVNRGRTRRTISPARTRSPGRRRVPFARYAHDRTIARARVRDSLGIRDCMNRSSRKPACSRATGNVSTIESGSHPGGSGTSGLRADPSGPGSVRSLSQPDRIECNAYTPEPADNDHLSKRARIEDWVAATFEF